MYEDDDDNFYEDEFDQDELREAGLESDITPEDVFSMVMINRKKKLKMTATLVDKDGSEIELSEVIEDLTDYIKEQLNSEEGNTFTDQIFPLMAQSVGSGLGRLIGLQSTAFIVGNEFLLQSTLDMMCLGFLLLKYVQKSGLTINTYQEEVSDEEIEEIEIKHQAISRMQMGSILGMDPKEILRDYVDRGELTEEDFKNFFPNTDLEKDDTDPDDE